MAALSPAERQERIEILRRFPAQLEARVRDLSAEDLTTRYMDEEWTVQQIVHHVADSHMNSIIRLKLILTEDYPPLKPYDQAIWAELPDTNAVPIQASLLILKGLHERFVALFESLTDDQWLRKGLHAANGDYTPDDILVIYSDHGQIHIDQINKVLAAKP
ncbi:MAG: DinB family protein [Burkholderiales bacterium]|nr:DinB family protein [Anaerolineae bacterium]